MEKCIYIGPARAFGLPLRRNMILAGKPSEVFPELKNIFIKYPDFQYLFVAPDKLSEARGAMRQPASLLSMILAQTFEQAAKHKQPKQDGEE